MFKIMLTVALSCVLLPAGASDKKDSVACREYKDLVSKFGANGASVALRMDLNRSLDDLAGGVAEKDYNNWKAQGKADAYEKSVDVFNELRSAVEGAYTLINEQIDEHGMDAFLRIHCKTPRTTMRDIAYNHVVMITKAKENIRKNQSAKP